MSRGARLAGAGPSARLPARVDAGPLDGPVRTCVGCRARGPRSVLLRVVAVTDDAGTSRAVVDSRRSLPGRGAWVHADPECLELAERRRAFPRALRVGTLDLAAVRAHLDQPGHDAAGTAVAAKHVRRITGSESGLEADGHPMSTQR
ncbi:YlxR family protein [Actinotalea fermentans]|uniref:YlxR family protein n=1 Tax=Actinotalea fermentans TaxID=43671 RepID=UPI0011BF3928|nr:YlxR family protein [Actinotalea fermentans]